MKRAAFAVVAAAGLAIWAAPGIAGETKGDEKSHAGMKSEAKGEKAAAGKQEMDPQMQAWMEYATPGPEHQWLAKTEGKWDTKVKWTMEPGGEAEESTGTAVRKMIMGGRYIEERSEGMSNGERFEGVGYTAYDNGAKQFTSTWLDNMSTGLMVAKGSRDGKVLTTESDAYCPMAGKVVHFKGKLTVTDDNHMSFEMWSPDKDGKMFKGLEVAYTRSGSGTN
jgi:hypothetical protein